MSKHKRGGAADQAKTRTRAAQKWKSATLTRSGYGFVELVVVMAIICLLIGLFLPAVNAAREAARRNHCLRHLSQLVLAAQNYEATFTVYPAGTIARRGPILSQPQGFHHSWITQLLPYLDEHNADHLLDRKLSVYHVKNRPVRQHGIRVLHCPSSSTRGRGYSDYAGVHNHIEAPIDSGNTGVFYLNSGVGYRDLIDGASNTIVIGEKYTWDGDLGWVSGTRATLRNTGIPLNLTPPVVRAVRLPPAGARDSAVRQDQAVVTDLFGSANPDEVRRNWGPGGSRPVPQELRRLAIPSDSRLAVGGFGSHHPGGSQFAFGDGSVRVISVAIDAETLLRHAHRADRKFISDEQR